MEKISVNSDATITLQNDGTFTAEEAKKLLLKIGEASQQAAQDPVSLEGKMAQVILDVPFWVNWVMGPSPSGISTVSFRHPEFGWMSFGHGLLDPAKMAQLIGNNLVQGMTAATTAASSGPDTLQ